MDELDEGLMRIADEIAEEKERKLTAKWGPPEARRRRERLVDIWWERERERQAEGKDIFRRSYAAVAWKERAEYIWFMVGFCWIVWSVAVFFTPYGYLIVNHFPVWFLITLGGFLIFRRLGRMSDLIIPELTREDAPSTEALEREFGAEADVSGIYVDWKALKKAKAGRIETIKGREARRSAARGAFVWCCVPMMLWSPVLLSYLYVVAAHPDTEVGTWWIWTTIACAAPLAAGGIRSLIVRSRPADIPMPRRTDFMRKDAPSSAGRAA